MTLSTTNNKKNIFELLFISLLWMLASIFVLTLLAMFIDMISGGFKLLSWEFISTLPTNSGRTGGIFPIIVSTLTIIMLCMLIALPLGLFTALLLTEFLPKNGFFARIIRVSLDVLAGIPSIVFGLFGNAFFCIYLGFGYSLISGALTLACMVLPFLIRTIVEGLLSLPLHYRRSCAALGFTKSACIVKLIIPAAIPSIIAGILLALGRALSETAALLFTSGYVYRMPESIWDPGRSLSVHIYDLAMNIPGGDSTAQASGLVLLLTVLGVNSTIVLFGNRWHTRLIKPA